MIVVFSVSKMCFFSSRGRVWVHHLSFSSRHSQNSDRCWRPLLITIPVVAFFSPLICIHKQTIKNWVSHCWLPFRQWPELKLRWWTQTLPRLYRIHSKTRNVMVTQTNRMVRFESILQNTMLTKKFNTSWIDNWVYSRGKHAKKSDSSEHSHCSLLPLVMWLVINNVQENPLKFLNQYKNTNKKDLLNLVNTWRNLLTCGKKPPPSNSLTSKHSWYRISEYAVQPDTCLIFLLCFTNAFTLDSWQSFWFCIQSKRNQSLARIARCWRSLYKSLS